MNDDLFFNSHENERIEVDRRLELLADLALDGLDEADLSELEGLDGTAADAEPLRLAAAAVFLALEPRAEADLPADLRRRVSADALAFFAPISRSGWRGSGGRHRISPWLGWVAAAACLGLLVFSTGKSVPRSTPVPALEERLAGIAAVKFVRTEHPLAAGASGEVVWSGDRQEGFLVIRGLAEVEPASGTYQLWIFDDSRDARFPIDGGMFTIRDAALATHVPIRATLPVRQPTLFAVTLEPPGGVVVSDRKRLLLTAAVSR